MERHQSAIGAASQGVDRLLLPDALPFEAEDAVQETVLRAWRGIERFEGGVALVASTYWRPIKETSVSSSCEAFESLT